MKSVQEAISNNKKKALGELRFDGNEENEYRTAQGLRH
jgi:hypothetical protein